MKQFILKQKGKTDEESLARSAFCVGMVLYGYCCGFFGRDSYGDKKITAIGENFIVTENEEGHIEQSFEITSWVDLLESSNHELEMREKYDQPRES